MLRALFEQRTQSSHSVWIFIVWPFVNIQTQGCNLELCNPNQATGTNLLIKMLKFRKLINASFPMAQCCSLVLGRYVWEVLNTKKAKYGWGEGFKKQFKYDAFGEVSWETMRYYRLFESLLWLYIEMLTFLNGYYICHKQKIMGLSTILWCRVPTWSKFVFCWRALYLLVASINSRSFSSFSSLALFEHSSRLCLWSVFSFCRDFSSLNLYSNITVIIKSY